MASKVESWNVNTKCRAFLKGTSGRPGMSGFDGTDMREPCRVQYFMELIVIEARGIEPVAVERFVVGGSELHCCAARQLDNDYLSDVGRS